jgi:hypothetical protein
MVKRRSIDGRCRRHFSLRTERPTSAEGQGTGLTVRINCSDGSELELVAERIVALSAEDVLDHVDQMIKVLLAAEEKRPSKRRWLTSAHSPYPGVVGAHCRRRFALPGLRPTVVVDGLSVGQQEVPALAVSDRGSALQEQANAKPYQDKPGDPIKGPSHRGETQHRPNLVDQ